MLLPAREPARLRRACLGAAALWLGACSALPPASYPAFAEHSLAADFVVPADGLLRLPASTGDLVVHRLTATPPPQRERFGSAGERWFVYPAGTHVHVQCSCRSYARADGRPLAPAQLLPGANHLEVLTAP